MNAIVVSISFEGIVIIGAVIIVASLLKFALTVIKELKDKL